MNAVNCKRCGKPCQPGVGNPESRPFHRSNKGYCVNCAITQFLKTTEPISSLLANLGVKVFYNPDIQEQIAHIMEAGHCDASPSEISWITVIENWELPFPKR